VIDPGTASAMASLLDSRREFDCHRRDPPANVVNSLRYHDGVYR
jgi:hypothetical protein